MSKKIMTEAEKGICAAIQDDIPLEPRPFEKLAKKIGISEDEFIKKANDFLEKGYWITDYYIEEIIKRFKEH